MERASTGIRELDQITGGGLPTGSLIILAGAPGTGKTILAQQIAFANATPEHKAVYYTTLSEPHSKLIRHLEQFEWFSADALGKIVDFIHLPGLGVDVDLDTFSKEISRTSFEIEPSIIVIDSSRALHDFAPPERLRQVVYDLASRVAHSNAILIFVGEYGPEDMITAPEFAVADGIIQIANDPSGSTDRRSLRVAKMRGTGHLPGRHTFRITDAGIKVYPRTESIVRGRGEVEAHRLSTGIPALDQMIGGGLPAGSATLVAGPSGAGKTVMGLQFVAEGLARGEKCVFIALQESPAQLLSKAKAFGWDLRAALEQGQLVIKSVQPVELNLDVAAAEIRAAVSHGSKRIVLDSLAELHHAAQTERFADYIWALIESFREVSATTLVTSETEAFFGPSFELARGISFVVDNVILMRYTELASEIRRALGVVKMRDSDHVKSLVEFEVTARGIEVKGKFAGMSGVLTGTPVGTAEAFKDFFNR